MCIVKVTFSYMLSAQISQEIIIFVHVFIYFFFRQNLQSIENKIN